MHKLMCIVLSAVVIALCRAIRVVCLHDVSMIVIGVEGADQGEEEPSHHHVAPGMFLPHKPSHIYALLLRPVEYEFAEVGQDRFGYRCKPAECFLNSAILRTSRKIYREACDVMVKDNKFVLLQSRGNISLRILLKAHSTSIVTTDEMQISQFKGYALKLELLSDKRLDPRYMTAKDTYMALMSVMMLAKDLDSLCESLPRSERHVRGLSLAVTLSLSLAPTFDSRTETQNLQTSLLLTDTIQARLLQPFHRHLRRFKKSVVWGDVAPKTVQVFRDDIAAD
jgi:hypothetical protein